MSKRPNPEADVAKRERAIAALLSCSSISEAADEAGIPRSTFRRLILQSDFQAQLREAKRAVLEGALVSLSGLAQRAAKVLQDALDNRPVSATRLRAAQWTIDRAVSGWEIMDLAREVDELKKRVGA